MDGTGSGTYPVADFDISSVEPWSPTIKELVIVVSSKTVVIVIF